MSSDNRAPFLIGIPESAETASAIILLIVIVRAWAKYTWWQRHKATTTNRESATPLLGYR